MVSHGEFKRSDVIQHTATCPKCNESFRCITGVTVTGTVYVRDIE